MYHSRYKHSLHSLVCLSAKVWSRQTVSLTGLSKQLECRVYIALLPLQLVLHIQQIVLRAVFDLEMEILLVVFLSQIMRINKVFFGVFCSQTSQILIRLLQTQTRSLCTRGDGFFRSNSCTKLSPKYISMRFR
jgi:hypothetical protein